MSIQFLSDRLLEDSEDLADIEARKDEKGIPLDDMLAELGLTREKLLEEAGN
jgi:hypothetical protein